jgi:hypothetical protein
MAGGERLDPGHDTLVAMRAAQLGQPLVVAVDDLHAGLAGPLDELPHALIAPCGVDLQLDDGLRRRLQPHGDGMKAEQDLGFHPAMVASTFHSGVTTEA